MLHGLLFYHLFFSPLVDLIVRAKASICPHIFDMVVIHVVFKGNAFQFIRIIPKKSCMVLCESHQYWFQFDVICKTRMPPFIVMKKFQWEGIQLCAIFVGFLSWSSGSFKCGWVVQREEGRTSWCIEAYLQEIEEYVEQGVIYYSTGFS